MGYFRCVICMARECMVYVSYIYTSLYVATYNIQRMLYALSLFLFFFVCFLAVVVTEVCGLAPAFLSCFFGPGCGPRMLARLGVWPPCAVAVILVCGGRCVSVLVLSELASIVH